MAKTPFLGQPFNKKNNSSPSSSSSSIRHWTTSDLVKPAFLITVVQPLFSNKSIIAPINTISVSTGPSIKVSLSRGSNADRSHSHFAFQMF